MIAPSETPATDSASPRVSLLAWGAFAFASALLVGSIAFVAMARGDDAIDCALEHPCSAPVVYYFNLYSSDRDAGFPAMRAKLKMGPFPDLAVCYALGAIGLEALNDKYPTKDFAGGCQNGEILMLREVVDRALALLPKDQPQEKNR